MSGSVEVVQAPLCLLREANTPDGTFDACEPGLVGNTQWEAGLEIASIAWSDGAQSFG